MCGFATGIVRFRYSLNQCDLMYTKTIQTFRKNIVTIIAWSQCIRTFLLVYK